MYPDRPKHSSLTGPDPETWVKNPEPGKFMSSEKILGSLPQVPVRTGHPSIHEKTETGCDHKAVENFHFGSPSPALAFSQDRTLDPGWAGGRRLPRVGHSQGGVQVPVVTFPRPPADMAGAAPQRLPPADLRNCRPGAFPQSEVKFCPGLPSIRERVEPYTPILTHQYVVPSHPTPTPCASSCFC